MKYRKISIETTTKAVDYISAMLDELGLEGIEIEDKVPLTREEKEAMFIDILLDRGEDDGKAVVSSYVEMDADIEDLSESIKSGLKEWSEFVDIGSGRVIISETDDKDWLNNWKEFFKPFRVTEDIVIKPTWEELEEKNPGDIVIEIDPGTAFGTGSHETTKFCIIALEEALKKGRESSGDGSLKVLDVGCGSGILSIIALKLGAGMVRATEIDENAVKITLENLKVNGIGDKADFKVYQGDIISDESLQKEVGEGIYDIVAANILADIIIPLSGEIGKHLKPGGVFISSGILNTRQEEVVNALVSNGFLVTKISPMNDWVSIQAVKGT